MSGPRSAFATGSLAHARPQRIPLVCAALLALLALAGLLGNVNTLAGPMRLVALGWLSACGFLAAGVALLATRFPSRSRERIQIGAGVLLLLAALPGWLPESQAIPGAGFSPNTAVALIASGLALILMHTPRRAWAGIVATVAMYSVFLVGLTGLVGYTLDLEFMYAWIEGARMAPGTALGFVILAVGLWSTASRVRNVRGLLHDREDLRIGLIGGALLAALALTAGLTGFALLEHQTEHTLRRSLELTLRHRLDTTQAEIERAVAEALALARSVPVQTALVRLRRGEVQRELLEQALPASLRTPFAAFTLREPDGQTQLTVGTPTRTRERGLALQLPYSAELIDLAPVRLRIEVPVTTARRALGTVVLERPLDGLTRLLADSDNLGRSGELLLCAPGPVPDGPLRCLSGAAEATRLDLTPPAPTAPILRALHGEQGLALAHADHRGVPVIAAYAPLGTLGLGMVVKMSTVELYAPIRGQFQKVMLLLAALTVGGIVLLRWQLHPIAKRLVTSEARLRNANHELREREARIRAILDGTSDAVFLKDTQGRYVLINAAGARLLGKTPDEIIGRDDAALTTAEIARQIRAADHIVLRTGSAHTHEETLLVNGAPRVFLANKAPYRDADGNIVGLIGIARDISERKQAEETIRSLSLTDELTGLHNRRGLLTLARPALELATRNRHRVFLFFIDLDGMKGINDRFGHEQGDQALRDAAAVLRATFRESDILARLGGDELVVLALETRAEDPETLSARLQQAVDQHNDRAGRVYHLALSIGTVAAHPDGRVTIEELLTQADMAMYQQKLQRKLALA